MQHSRLQLLHTVPVFGGLKDETLEFLLELSSIITVAKGEFFFRENDKATSMFILEKGRVAVLKNWKGRDFLLRELVSTDCFGEMALLDFCPRSASVVALENCTAIELNAESLHKLYKKDLEQFTIIQMNIARELSRRLRETDRLTFESKVEATILNGDISFHNI